MPTKKGVSLLPHEWSVLASHLEFNEEFKLAKKVLEDMLHMKVRQGVQKACDGCQQQWPSQRDHLCLTEGREHTAEVILDAAVLAVSIPEYIFHVAEEARSKEMILESPHDTLKMVLLFQLNDIKERIMSDYVML